MFTFQRVGAAHTRLLTLCVCSPAAEPWATRTLVITRPLLEAADSIGRFLSALQGCREACWHGFLVFHRALQWWTQSSGWLCLHPTHCKVHLSASLMIRVVCIIRLWTTGSLFSALLALVTSALQPLLDRATLTDLSKRKQGPRAVFLKWDGHTGAGGSKMPIWCGKKWLLEHFCSFCFKKVSFTKLTVWIVPGYSHGPVLRQPSASPGHSLYFCSCDYCGYAAQAVCALAGSFTDCISSFPKLILTEQTSGFIRKSCKDTSDWG